MDTNERQSPQLNVGTVRRIVFGIGFVLFSDFQFAFPFGLAAVWKIAGLKSLYLLYPSGMTLIPGCQTALLAAIFLSMIYPVSAGSLNAYRWKNRLIVVSLPGRESRDGFAASLASNRAEIDERDLKLIDVSPGSARIPHTLRLDRLQTKALRERLKLSSSESRAIFILIGKDGGEKARQLGTLNLASWFRLIDEMPMRREEIRQQQKSQE